MKKSNMISNRKRNFFTGMAAAIFLTTNVSGQSLTQTFETGQDTSDWGSTWQTTGTFGMIGNGFLDPSLGGVNAGYASNTSGQTAQRSFANNSVGLNVSTMTYTVSMYFLVSPDPGNTPASGHLNILDGQFGDYTANLQLSYDNNGSGYTSLSFDALSGNGQLNPLNVNIDLTHPYFLEFTVDPLSKTYSTTLSEVDTDGNVLSTATQNNLMITGNAINNHQNGNLELYLNTSAGTGEVWVDNIVIAAPEPSGTMLIPVGAVLLTFFLIKRKHSRSLIPVKE